MVGQSGYPGVAAARSTAVILAIAIVLWPTAWRRPALAARLLATCAIGLARIYFGDDDAAGLLSGWSLATVWVAALALAGRPLAARRPHAAPRQLMEPDLVLSFEALASRLQVQQRGLLEAVRAEVGHRRGDCAACRFPAPPSRDAALLRAVLAALGGGRSVKVRQAVVLGARLTLR